MRSRSTAGACVIAATGAVICAVICAVTLPAQGRRTERVVLVTLDGARWQEVFAGLDESLLRAVTPKDADITMTPSYRRFWAPTPEARRDKLMPFLRREHLLFMTLVMYDIGQP